MKPSRRLMDHQPEMQSINQQQVHIKIQLKSLKEKTVPSQSLLLIIIHTPASMLAQTVGIQVDIQDQAMVAELEEDTLGILVIQDLIVDIIEIMEWPEDKRSCSSNKSTLKFISRIWGNSGYSLDSTNWSLKKCKWMEIAYLGLLLIKLMVMKTCMKTTERNVLRIFAKIKTTIFHSLKMMKQLMNTVMGWKMTQFGVDSLKWMPLLNDLNLMLSFIK